MQLFQLFLHLRFLRDALAGLPEHCLGADFLLNCLTHDDFIPRGGSTWISEK